MEMSVKFQKHNFILSSRSPNTSLNVLCHAVVETTEDDVGVDK